MKKILLISLLCLTSCSETLFKERADSFVNKPESNLVMFLGAPKFSYVLPNKDRVLTYVQEPTGTYSLECTLNFTVSNQSGNVIGYTYRGNNCVSYYGIDDLKKLN
jgi:hypothetical protein